MLRRLGLTLSIVLVIVGPQLVAQSPDLETLYATAQEAESSGDLSTAIGAYRKIVLLEPTLAEAFANLGSLYLRVEDAAQARLALEHAIRLKPSLAGPHFFLGVLSFKDGDFLKALREFKRADSLQPGVIDTESYLGYTEYALGHYANASDYLARSCRRSSQDAQLWYSLSKTYARLAEQNIRSLLSSFPGSDETIFVRGQQYEANGTYSLAIEEYRKLEDRHARIRGLQEHISQLAALSNQGTAGALRLPTEGVALSFVNDERPALDADASLLWEEKRVALAQKQSLSAVRCYSLGDGYRSMSYLASEHVIAVAPDSARAHQLQGQKFEALGKDEEAITEYRRAVALAPGITNLHFSIGNLFWKEHRLSEALIELQSEEKLDGTNALAHYEIGDIFFSTHRFDLAQGELMEAIRLEPNLPSAYAALADIRAAQNDLAGAERYLFEAIQHAPTEASLHYRLALLLRRRKMTARADEEMKTFQRLNSNERAK